METLHMVCLIHQSIIILLSMHGLVHARHDAWVLATYVE